MDEQNISDEYKVRLEKLNKLKKSGNIPYKSKFNKTHFTSDVSNMDEKSFRDGASVLSGPKNVCSVAGRVITKRDHGKIIFLDIADMKGELQVAIKNDCIGNDSFDFFNEFVDPGDFIGIEGEPFITKRGTLAVLATDVVLLSKAVSPLPSAFFGVKDVELKYRKRYLDLILNKKTQETFKIREKFVQASREWLLERSFREVVTRTLQTVYGGALAEPFKTHHNYLKKDFYLRISNELDLKMVACGGVERVFEFAIDFRNEGIDSSHLQEFQMLEWYKAYSDYIEGIEMTKDLLKYAVEKSLNKTTFTYNDHEFDLSKDIPTVTFSDLMKKYDIDIDATKEVLIKKSVDVGIKKELLQNKSRATILDDLYKKVARPNLKDPVFIIDHPTDLFPLARVSDKDPSKAESFQLVIMGWEVVKGYSELIDPQRQKIFFENQKKAREEGDLEAMPTNDEFLDAMEHGFPPMVGFGMGIDRIVTLITNNKNLKDTVLFPTLG